MLVRFVARRQNEDLLAKRTLPKIGGTLSFSFSVIRVIYEDNAHG